MKYKEFCKRLEELKADEEAAEVACHIAREAYKQFLFDILGVRPGDTATIAGVAAMISAIIEMKASDD